jgi:hypothetical protein
VDGNKVSCRKDCKYLKIIDLMDKEGLLGDRKKNIIFIDAPKMTGIRWKLR